MKFWRLCVYYYKPGKDWIRRMMRHFSSWNCLLLQSLCHSHHHVPNCVLFTSTWSSTTFFFLLFATSKKSQMSWVQSFSLHISAKCACFLIILRYQIKSLCFESTISLSRLTVIKQSHDKAPVLITAVSLCTVSPAGSDTVLYSEPPYQHCVYCQWRPLENKSNGHSAHCPSHAAVWYSHTGDKDRPSHIHFYTRWMTACAHHLLYADMAKE